MTVATVQRIRIRVTGVVQGVGFRPFVYHLAHELALAGFVGNDSSGVFIEGEGAAESLAKFERRLREEAPPLAHIESVQVTDIPACGDVTFIIAQSNAQPDKQTLISPDLTVCDDCLRELSDPNDRRYRYPFINCTNCGPRFTITQDVPYDRPLTTMAGFTMCPACHAEYDDPLNRRFHAQPNACPDCGPQVTFVHGDDVRCSGENAIQQTITSLENGAMVAIKGLGGFHLACDATNFDAVQRLRERKHRPSKPFALMARDVEQVRQFAVVSGEDEQLLTSRERPIVLLQKADNAHLPANIAPGNTTIGVMLPYTPLHYLLVGDVPLVMTSANVSGEPIIKDNDEAQSKLAHIADAFLLHNRDIHVHCDDSVVRADYPIRRSRGYAPFPMKLPFDVPPLLAVGGELKSTFCMAQGKQAFMSQHVGDMQNMETLYAFERAAEHMQAIFRIQPEAIVCDMHPRYLSSQWAQRFAAENNLPLVQVQHHHAHIASVMAEHHMAADAHVIGLAFDGTGYGTDGTIWGGEVFVGGYRGFERIEHLPPMPLPGGDAAVKLPSRLALAYLWACDIPWDDNLPPAQPCAPATHRILRQQLEKNLNVAQSSSMGRLFDVVAALIGVCDVSTYEGQAAIELEAMTAADVDTHYYAVDAKAFDLKPLLVNIITDLRDGLPITVIAAKFHNTIVKWVVATSLHLRQQYEINTVALSGGVFQNVYLRRRVQKQLQQHRFTVLTHQQVPPNDGGLALGQAVIGHFLLQEK
ncbi:MAG: carbamoyltransferase HypF [Chloroflexota bacterium]